VTAQLPELVDCAGIQREMKVKRTAAEAIMRDLPKIKIPGLDKTYVYRADVLKLLADSTIHAVSVRARKRAA